MNRRQFLKGALAATATLGGCKALPMPNVLQDKPIAWEANKIAPELYGRSPAATVLPDIQKVNMTATEVLRRRDEFFKEFSAQITKAKQVPRKLLI